MFLRQFGSRRGCGHRSSAGNCADDRSRGPLNDVDLVPGDVLLAINGSPSRAAPDGVEAAHRERGAARMWRGDQVELHFAIDPPVR
jgi:hypothetical protein